MDLNNTIIINLNGSMVAIDTDENIEQQIIQAIIGQWAKQYQDEISRDITGTLRIIKEMDELEQNDENIGSDSI